MRDGSRSFASIERSTASLRFYLGTHMTGWLSDPRFVRQPLFVSRRRLTGQRRLPRALGRWALDSGGFTELSMHGAWLTPPRSYAADVRRFRDEIGHMDWAAPQDWMCEPEMLQKTGLSVAEHQRRTVVNFLELRAADPDLPFAPVLQGYRVADYWRCQDLYLRHGVDLTREPIVGVGTLCRRQATDEAERIVTTLASGGLRLHGFGFKVQGLRRCRSLLASADSMAWSFHGRRAAPLPGHDLPGPGRPRGHKNCANCADYALGWVHDMLGGG